MRRHSGFSLIELLAVVGVIALLGAILHPVLLSARHKGHQAACLSNTKQIALAAIVYADDNSGMLPLAWTATPEDPWDPNGYGTRWYHRLWPYIRSGSREVFRCPAASMPPTYSNYSCNSSMQMSCDGSGQLVQIPWRISDVRYPTRRALIGDGVPHADSGQIGLASGDADASFRFWQGYPLVDYLMEQGDKATLSSLHARQIDYRHNDGANFAMLDGHSKWVPRGTLQEYNWWSPQEMPGGWLLKNAADSLRPAAN